MKKLVVFIVLACIISCTKTKSAKEATQNSLLTQQINKESTSIKQQQQSLQPINYFKVKPDTIIKKGVDEIIYISNIALTINTKKEKSEGLYLEVKKNNDKIFESKGQYDSWRFDIDFFKNNINNDILIVGEIGDEESWGVYIYKFSNNNFQELGFLDITAMDENNAATTITPFLIIKEIEENNFIIRFKGNTRVYDNEMEKSFSNAQIEYSYSDNKFKRKIKN